jgi:hypothetical protein
MSVVDWRRENEKCVTLSLIEESVMTQVDSNEYYLN